MSRGSLANVFSIPPESAVLGNPPFYLLIKINIIKYEI